MAATKTAGTARRRPAAKRTRRRMLPSAGPGTTAPGLPPGDFATRGLYGYIWATSGRAQIRLALLSVFIFLLDLVPLELQRRIVNDAIGRKIFGELIWLCGAYVVTALVQGLAKLAWNFYRNSVGEATSRRLRLETFTAALRHPQPDATAKEGVGISIIMSEADPVGLFVATSISEPVLHGGVLISVFAYLIYLQPWMAIVALALFVPQCAVVPLVQKAINRRTASRIQVMRHLSADIVAESAEGVLQREERAYKRRVSDIYALNLQIYWRKYAMNFLINLLYHFGTVGILFVGGWFVMQGKTEVGTVVAFISGLTKVNDPWNDLVTFFRDMTNARVKYRLIARVLDDQDPGEAAGKKP
ncbi:MAG TPA: ABC transporter ATP-binding protein [Stellaceae bacterium]|jgi:ABC-type bacteriocin/lantibiotic exporter with double-glycine peptidase domain|nr:ABC transporter ATP-binding protein [Stellaceae bacterium]